MKLDKIAIKKKMLELEEQQLLYAEAHYNDYLRSAKVDRSETFDDQDLSQASLSGLLAEQFHCPLEDHEEALKILNETDFSEKEFVEPGAVVRFNNKNFVVSIASDSFECQGQSFIGISTAAPIYQAMIDLEAGDVFDFNDQEYTVEMVS